LGSSLIRDTSDAPQMMTLVMMVNDGDLIMYSSISSLTRYFLGLQLGFYDKTWLLLTINA
jgi:hypothetical protein